MNPRRPHASSFISAAGNLAIYWAMSTEILRFHAKGEIVMGRTAGPAKICVSLEENII